MADHPPARPPERAAGALIAVTTMAGALGGTLLGQPSIGVVGGFAVGAIGAAALWWRDRR